MYPSVNPKSKVPSVEQRLKNLEELRAEAHASLEMAAKMMEMNHGNHTHEQKPFEKGDKVLLSGKNLKTTRPKAKLLNR